MIPLVQRKP